MGPLLSDSRNLMGTFTNSILTHIFKEAKRSSNNLAKLGVVRWILNDSLPKKIGKKWGESEVWTTSKWYHKKCHYPSTSGRVKIWFFKGANFTYKYAYVLKYILLETNMKYKKPIHEWCISVKKEIIIIIFCLFIEGFFFFYMITYF